jgi:thioester reductase-like protein
VSGNSFEQAPDFPPTVFDETKLYIGQPLENVYVRSKFESEVAVLQAKLEGLDAAVIRVGNLSNRRSDLKFQKNHHENATLTRLRIKCCCFLLSSRPLMSPQKPY